MKKHIDKMQEMFTLRNIFNFILMFLSSGVIFVAMVYGFMNASGAEEKGVCLDYQEYAKEFTGFWISAEMKVKCDNYNIPIDAQVH